MSFAYPPRRGGWLAALVLLLLTGLLALPPAALARDRLNANQSLERNQALVSQNKQYRLYMQDDGNLALYKIKGNQALWTSNTAGVAAKLLAMQGDCNLVLQKFDGSPAWASNTAGPSGCHLILQDDGNLVLYQGSNVLWNTGTQGR
ncbi:MAG: lectin [Deltaproteobacteria bacterium]|nr:lectin [Deltaproteobacteria bacterium]